MLYCCYLYYCFDSLITALYIVLYFSYTLKKIALRINHSIIISFIHVHSVIYLYEHSTSITNQMSVKIPPHQQREDNGTQGGTNPRGGVLIFAGTNPCGGGVQTLLGWYVY